MFEPFTKGSSPSDDLSGNIGLGLYIVREIARAHQGKDMCSRADTGTSFVVKLPRHPPGEQRCGQGGVMPWVECIAAPAGARIRPAREGGIGAPLAREFTASKQR